MSARFRIFLKAINAYPENAQHMIKAGIVLHNFLSTNDPQYAEATFGDRLNSNGNITPGQWRNEMSQSTSTCFKDLAPKSGSNSSQSAKEVRDTFKRYFNSEQGSVPWQDEIVSADGHESEWNV